MGNRQGQRLNIEYVSQNGPGATYGVGDCGIADLTAHIRTLTPHQWLTVDNVGQAARLVAGYTSADTWTIQHAAALFGLSFVWKGGLTHIDLMDLLDDRRSIIVLVYYPALPQKRLKDYRQNHFITIHGYQWRGTRLDFFADDPEWLTREEGENIRISSPVLINAMNRILTKSNTPRQGLILSSHQLSVWTQ